MKRTKIFINLSKKLKNNYPSINNIENGRITKLKEKVTLIT